MKIRFSGRKDAEFFTELKRRVDTYFAENNISPNANTLMVLKSIFFLGIFATTYLLILSGAFSMGVMVLLTIILGLFTAFIGFNVSHDAVHGSYSSNAKINRILGYTFDFLGASSYIWSLMHNIIHHTYTNIPEHDEDLEPVFFIRLNKSKKLYKIHRYQHWYATFFYALTSLSWVFLKDFKALLKKEITHLSHKKHPIKEVLTIIISKSLYYFMFIALPIIVLDIAWWQALLGFIIMHVAEGITLAIVFQLAHVVEHADFPEPAANGSIENNWAVHQLHTTANFARKSFLATWFFGGLNYQVEHHLFPRICHIHYPKVSKIVESTAREYNIPYKEYKTMWQAMKSHYAMLKKLGREADPSVAPAMA